MRRRGGGGKWRPNQEKKLRRETRWIGGSKSPHVKKGKKTEKNGKRKDRDEKAKGDSKANDVNGSLAKKQQTKESDKLEYHKPYQKGKEHRVKKKGGKKHPERASFRRKRRMKKLASAPKRGGGE